MKKLSSLSIIDGILLLIAFSFLLIAAYFGWYFELLSWRGSSIISLIFAPFLLAIVLIFTIRARQSLKSGLLLALISVLVSLYTIELLLHIGLGSLLIPKNFDGRSRQQVVLDLRSQKLNAYPVVSPWVLEQAPQIISQLGIYPVAGISKVKTVFCNETGSYYVYNSDRYGFNNPDYVWDLEELDYLIIGDSFAHGMCVPDNQSFAEVIRGANKQLLNLGFNGNGPLIKYVSLLEYGQKFKARKTLWFYYEGNDYSDLLTEIKIPQINKYLKQENFFQNLQHKQSEIDAVYKSYTDSKLLEYTQQNLISKLKNWIVSDLISFIKLYSVRNLLSLNDPFAEWPTEFNSKDKQLFIDHFKQIVLSTHAALKTAGSEFIFVYLPAHRSFERGIDHPLKNEIFSFLASQNIKVIDFADIFKATGDPLRYFPWRRDGHYNAEGNKLIAEKILELD